MGKIIDITGETFNRLTAINLSHLQKGEAFWRCVCSCGTELYVASYKLRKNLTKSCGCLTSEKCRDLAKRINKLKRKPNLEGAWNKYFQSYRTGAIKRKYSFSLSREQFKELTQSNCFYCGEKPTERKFARSKQSQEWQQLQILLVNGLDRVDNLRGYEYDNVVPCCSICNSLKSDFPKQDFLNAVKKIAQYKGLLNG